LQEQLELRIFGASRRPLSTIFANNAVERAKVMKFFAP
jgi:hypothetical protein